MPRTPEAPDANDPYAPPPMHHDRSGAVVRIALVAAMLGAATWGYMSFAGQEQTALVPEPAQEQQLADSSYDTGYTVSPTATADSPPAAVTTPAPAPRAAPRQAQPAPEPEPAPAPAIDTPAPAPAAVTPLPPVDVPPAD